MRDTKRQNLLTLLTSKTEAFTIHYHAGTHIPNHCAHSAKFQFPAHQFLSQGKCSACSPIPSHPMGSFPWTSLRIS